MKSYSLIFKRTIKKSKIIFAIRGNRTRTSVVTGKRINNGATSIILKNGPDCR